MRRRFSAAFLFSRTAFLAAASLSAAVLAFVSCETNETPAVATQQAPVGSHTYPTNSAPYQPVDSNGQAASEGVPKPTPITFNGISPSLGGGGLGEPPTINAKSAILIDSRGRVLFEKNADEKRATASTQKLLLGIMIAERGGLSTPVTIAESDTWAEPTKMGIQAGQVYTREELLRTVLVRSCNDIANALARDYAGSVPAFAAMMDQKARSLGMYNSHFTNANGLPSPPGQYSTARDLSILGAAALRNPVVRQAIQTKTTIFRFPDGTTRTCRNTNQVLHHFPYCTGCKTGYTNAAGRCLVSSASANGRTVIAVILGSKTPDVWEESEALLRYGLKM